jgi:hypothetical protein
MSTLPPGKYLPRELWDEIFLWLASTSARHEGQHDSSAVRPLLQVCKVWKVRHPNISARAFIKRNKRTPLSRFSSANSTS